MPTRFVFVPSEPAVAPRPKTAGTAPQFFARARRASEQAPEDEPLPRRRASIVANTVQPIPFLPKHRVGTEPDAADEFALPALTRRVWPAAVHLRRPPIAPLPEEDENPWLWLRRRLIAPGGSGGPSTFSAVFALGCNLGDGFFENGQLTMPLLKNTAGQHVFFDLVNLSNGQALTGATVTARVALDSVAQAVATRTVTELGNGQYRFDPSQADTNGNYVGYSFTAPGAIPVSCNFLTLLGPGQGNVTVVNPVAQNGSVTIVRGDDYATVDGRQLSFVNPAGTWPNLTGATIDFGIRNRLTGQLLLETAGVVTSPTGNQTVTVDLTAIQTNAFPVSTPANPLYYDVVATLGNNHVVTLQTGDLIVIQNATT